MNKSVNLVLDDEDIMELIRILMDAAGSELAFLKKRIKGNPRDLLEGG